MLVCLSVLETAGMCFMLLLSVSGQPKTNVHPDWKKKVYSVVFYSVP